MASENEINAEIGRRIRQIREKQGITQHELALRCDIEASNMCRIESGNTNLTIKTMFRICTALEIPFHRLTDGIQ